MPAIERCSADVVIVVDSDVTCDGIGAAVAAVEGGKPWAMPHGQVYRLTEESTAEVLAGAEPHRRMKLDQPGYPGVWGGGIVVLPRETALEVRIDSRFVGWGSEDLAWACALTTLAGKGWRGDAPLFHLYHPPQPRLTRKRGSVASHQLFRRYTSARRDPNRMRALLEEAKRFALDTPEPAVHADP